MGHNLSVISIKMVKNYLTKFENEIKIYSKYEPSHHITDCRKILYTVLTSYFEID
jgi:hypothetical protein